MLLFCCFVVSVVCYGCIIADVPALFCDKITLKCTAFSGQAFRKAYPGVVVRGYRCPPVQQPYWNTIDLKLFPHEELPMMIDHAYETVVSSLLKKVQQDIFSDAT